MADEEHVALLKQGVEVWNKWREENPDVRPDLIGANLRGAHLPGADLKEARLEGADLFDADLEEADLRGALLAGALLPGAAFFDADLSGADLTGADLTGAHLEGAHLFDAKLPGAVLTGGNLYRTHLEGADLSGADLSSANLSEANLEGADLSGADLMHANLVEVDLTNADLTSCRIYGISAWGLKLSEDTKQRNLVITSEHEPEITVDNIEVAQFIYLLLHNQKIRDAIDTIGKKAVLILGRFTGERKKVLDTLREELRKRDFLPILFDFDKPDGKDLTGTVQTLANTARFIIADLTEPSCIPHELAMLVPTTIVPVRPILLVGQHEYAMFIDLKRRHHWVLEPYSYDSSDQLIADLSTVIHPAEAKALELRGVKPETGGSVA